VFLTDYGEHPMKALLDLNKISYLALDGSMLSLYRALHLSRPALIHTHGYKAGICGRLAARLNKIPVITTYHAGEIGRGKLALYDWFDRITAGFADKAFAVSPQIAKRLPTSIEVFDNFINTNNLTRSCGKQIAFVGRLSEEKGPDYFAQIASCLPSITFHVYGDGPQLDELAMAAPANFQLHGQQDDMSLVWPQIGLLVMPSRHEGLPMAALEAMARGIPVLASDVGALNKLIKSNNNGWLVEVGNIKDFVRIIQVWQQKAPQQQQIFKSAAKQTIQQSFSTQSEAYMHY
jgi:glycosyltransferase involved in cell wall biosynthesis